MSLFARLFKYRATRERSPHEDFLTEALAGVLESSLPLRVAFVQWLVEHNVETVRVETQKSAGSYGRLDLWLEAWERSGERHVVVFENKIWSGEGENQLGRYEEYLQKRHAKAECRTLIYLTPHAHTEFKPSENTNDPAVVFRELHWFQVYKWMTAWTQGLVMEARPSVLVKELLTLMEEWNLTIELNASDLAAAVAHRTSVERRMLQLLDEVYAACRSRLPSTPGKWSYNRRHLTYSSPYLGGDENLYFSFGFDFSREDDVWSVNGLQLPSAYFAVHVDKVDQLDQEAMSSDWMTPPEGWGWTEVVRVKQLSCLKAQAGSLHEAYLEFFNQALMEALSATSLDKPDRSLKS